ncbi:PucR family transcriptional regulator [Garciella nitratireducens]|uniref:PucR family transcriptional regulator n=1 Tax=Garciella nitratireducens TaxID=218205 RepID=UPI000DE94D55|nr:helix-turn-helix domain-containing protein [Garciella nitratireducens]RBP45472.1 DNA-binding PucR family transcriptional regulator [Garciella nitratireducens]
MKESKKDTEFPHKIVERSSCSFHTLADEIANQIGYPITIEDAFHHLISYSRHQGKIDQARVDTIINKKVPDKVINSLWKSGIMKQILEKEEPIIVPAKEKVGLGNRVVISMKYDSRIIGFIWVHINKKMLTPFQLQLLKKSANLVKYELLHYSTKANEEEKRREFFFHLLSGFCQQKENMLIQETNLNISSDQRCTIVIIHFNKEIDSKIQEYISNYIKNIYLPQVISFIFDQDQVIFLMGEKNTKENGKNILLFIQNFIREIYQQLQIKDIIGVFGMSYQSLAYMKDSYEQALKVLELKRKFPIELASVYGYHQLGIYQFIDEIYQNRIRTHYRNEKIQRLKEYDYHHNTDLLSTLEIYLDCDCNSQKASEKIHIHPNTLNYRLKRVIEIGQLDFSNFNEKITLYIDLKLEKNFYK